MSVLVGGASALIGALSMLIITTNMFQSSWRQSHCKPIWWSWGWSVAPPDGKRCPYFSRAAGPVFGSVSSRGNKVHCWLTGSVCGCNLSNSLGGSTDSGQAADGRSFPTWRTPGHCLATETPPLHRWLAVLSLGRHHRADALVARAVSSVEKQRRVRNVCPCTSQREAEENKSCNKRQSPKYHPTAHPLTAIMAKFHAAFAFPSFVISLIDWKHSLRRRKEISQMPEKEQESGS